MRAARVVGHSKLAEPAADDADRPLANAKRALRGARKKATEQAPAGLKDTAAGHPHLTKIADLAA